MKINTQELKTALETVRSGLASKEIIEQSTSFAFLNGSVVTYNDEISITHPVEGLEIEGAIQATELYQFISKITKEEIDIEINESEICLKSGRSKAWLTLKEAITLPLDSIGTRGKWKTLPEGFCKAVKFAAASCSKNFSLSNLTGVHVSENIIEGSDSFRITRCILEEPVLVKQFIIPASSALEVIKLNPIKISEGEGWIHFLTDQKTVISCRILQDKEYPNTEPFLKGKGEKIAFPSRILDIIDQATPFTKRDHVLDEDIEIIIADEKIVVKAQSDAGRFEGNTKIDYQGEPIQFSIIPYLLKDILNETLDCIICKDKLKFKGDNWVYVTILKSK